ncbi:MULTISPECIES: hypothetical protein [Calothrix]|uniref:Uncharacterized protein n=2 Tax=Calothrix TaxID=1186 RepID=A0ABR8A8K9_9CYAN|nr:MULTISPECIES: hypothetical protein [Calothrix]MBD2195097.1 hypothetical protein [Calothrix parietina FACHB-288]MBD2223695.1 hypothetical protein [Calothrix anomala FACHB-343]
MKSKLSKNQTVIQQNNSKVIDLSDLNELTNQEAEMITGGSYPPSGTGGTGSGSGTWFEGNQAS